MSAVAAKITTARVRAAAAHDGGAPTNSMTLVQPIVLSEDAAGVIGSHERHQRA
jgi:hypothetical protein